VCVKTQVETQIFARGFATHRNRKPRSLTLSAMIPFAITIVLFAVLYLLYKHRRRGQNISVECAPEWRPYLQDMVDRCAYFPAFYTAFDYHGQLQTIVQFILRHVTFIIRAVIHMRRPMDYTREKFLASDGGLLGLDWAYLNTSKGKEYNSKHGNLIVIHHGLGGSSRSDYIVHLAERLLLLNYQVVAVNARGCGGLEITTDRFVRRKTDDMREIVKHIQLTRPNVENIYCVGFSLGAAYTLKYLGEEGANSPITAAVCVSPPWDMQCHTAVFHIWSYFVVWLLKGYIFQHRRLLSGTGVTMADVWRAKSLEDMDRLLIKSYGYNNLTEYYKDTSPIYFSRGIKTPTLSISSEDDPICSSSACPTIGSGNLGPGLCVLKTPFGGHCSFPAGVMPLRTAWTDDIIVEWFAKHQSKRDG
jgi:predicted alpha/beta-fold hydrolase